MSWKLDKNKPLCPQICEQICLHIALGDLAPDQRIPSVREAAQNAGVNPNTMQRSYESLEQEGILYSVRGAGWYVYPDISRAKQTLEQLKMHKTDAFFNEMHNLGMTGDEIKNYIKEWYK